MVCFTHHICLFIFRKVRIKQHVNNVPTQDDDDDDDDDNEDDDVDDVEELPLFFVLQEK